jgi:hypothetical protein
VVCTEDQSDGVLWFSVIAESIQMPSAILPFYTSEGFLIAADGRRRVNKEKRGDDTTKIFEISEPGKSLAYAFGGTVAFTDKENEDLIMFDFRDEILKIIRSQRMANHNNLQSYTWKIAVRLHERLTHALTNERMERLTDEGAVETPADVACLIVAGYYEKYPSWVAIKFPHIGQALLEPKLQVMTLAKGYMPPVIYGAQIVFQKIFMLDDPAFAKYRIPRIHMPEDVTLEEVAESAKRYIRACDDPEVIKIDPMCASIGGDIHIAKVTPQSGFEWMVPPQKLNPD